MATDNFDRPIYFVPVMLHVEATSRADAIERLWNALDAEGSANMPITVNGIEIAYMTTPGDESDLATFPGWIDRIIKEGDVPQYHLDHATL